MISRILIRLLNEYHFQHRAACRLRSCSKISDIYYLYQQIPNFLDILAQLLPIHKIAYPKLSSIIEQVAPLGAKRLSRDLFLAILRLHNSLSNKSAQILKGRSMQMNIQH